MSTDGLDTIEDSRGCPLFTGVADCLQVVTEKRAEPSKPREVLSAPGEQHFFGPRRG